MSSTDILLDDTSRRAQASAGGASVGDYFALLKPRVMSLVVFTALVGMLVAPAPESPYLAAIALFALAVGAGASGALNMWYDADIDGGMARTRGRPLPRGKISRSDALAFGAALSLFSVMVMGLAANLLAAGLLAFTIAFYVFVYTMWLKRRTPHNIVIGGAAGALPPVVAWAAVTGSLSFEPLVLFLIIFLWTPPHFWALALYREGDYAKVGVPMLPVVKGVPATCTQMVAYSLVLAASAMLPLIFGFAGWLYGGVAAALSLAFVALTWRVSAARHDAARLERRARTLFAFSLFYLALIFASLMVEHALAIAPVPGWV